MKGDQMKRGDADKSEAAIERLVRTYARGRGVLCLKFVSPACRGVPDRLFLFPDGRAAFGEFKRKGKKPTALQAHWIHKLQEQGFRAEVIDCVEAGKRFVDEILYLC